MRRHKGESHHLSQVRGFRGCSQRQLAEIDRLTDRYVASPGRVLVREGMLGRELIVIISGTATVTRNGRLVTTLGPGDYFGELGAIETGHCNATLTAITMLDVLIVGPREFASLVADIVGFRDTVMRGMAKRLRAADDALELMMLEIQQQPDCEIHPILARGSAS